MGKELATHFQETQRVPYRINSKKNMLRHILIKLTKIKHKKNIKSTKGKATNHIQGIPKRLIADLSAETASQKGIAGYT